MQYLVGLDNLEGLFQPTGFYDSTFPSARGKELTERKAGGDRCKLDVGLGSSVTY